jgi:hypothetical protein
MRLCIRMIHFPWIHLNEIRLNKSALSITHIMTRQIQEEQADFRSTNSMKVRLLSEK